MSQTKSSSFYHVHYRNPKDGNIVSIKARKITDSTLGLSFVAVSDFIFETDGILVNPDEEAKKMEFENVKTLHLSIYSILSVTEEGQSAKSLKFKKDKSNLLVLANETNRPSTN